VSGKKEIRDQGSGMIGQGIRSQWNGDQETGIRGSGDQETGIREEGIWFRDGFSNDLQLIFHGIDQPLDDPGNFNNFLQ